MTHHSDPEKGIGIDFPLPHKLDGTELRQAVDEATTILKDPITVTLGDDALLASEQLDPSDRIRGQEARDFHDLIFPVTEEFLDLDGESSQAEKLYPVHTDQAPPGLAVWNMYLFQDPGKVQTSIIFAGNPFGDGKHLSAHVNATYGANNRLADVNVSYLQDLPGDDGRFPKTTALPLAPDERNRVAEAIQRQIIPANLTKTPPGTG